MNYPIQADVVPFLKSVAESCRPFAEAQSVTLSLEIPMESLVVHYHPEEVAGDLKDPASLAAACAGVDAIISTTTSVATAREGDSIETVDHQGQLNLVAAARHAGVKRFVFISFRDNKSYPNPLSDAKRAVESALADSGGMAYCSLWANYFMEMWLSPFLGFDYPNGKARVYGTGDNKISWVSYKDVARYAVAALEGDFAANRIVEVGGPEALSPKEVIGIFEQAHGKVFEVEYVPVAVLEQQRSGSAQPLEQSFASLMLHYAEGVEMDMRETARFIPVRLTTVEDYARGVKG